jgi:hypothetical protein
LQAVECRTQRYFLGQYGNSHVLSHKP